MKLPLDIKRSIRLFRPVETEGLTLYPIMVSDYEDYLIGKPAIGMMQRSLPVAYLSMPLLQALYQIDFEHRVNGEAPEGWFYRTLLFLSLSLRLEGMKNGGNDLPFLLYADPENPKKLKEIRFFQNGEEKKITPIMFSRLRPILAAQNAIELYGDEVNPELVEAEADVAEAKSTKLDFRIEDMISGVCAVRRRRKRRGNVANCEADAEAKKPPARHGLHGLRRCRGKRMFVEARQPAAESVV